MQLDFRSYSSLSVDSLSNSRAGSLKHRYLLPLESEPRDAGTDQRSSGIIRLHTIKQIIDRVSMNSR